MIRTLPCAALVALTLCAGPGFAQDLSGVYGGFQFGALSGDASGSDGSGALAGAVLGYDVGVGDFVLGAEVDMNWGDVDLGQDLSVDSIARLKLRAGTTIGRTFVYGTAGVARADTSAGSGEGGFAGVGAGWRVGERVMLGGEVLYQQFDDIDGSGIDADATTATARVTFGF